MAMRMWVGFFAGLSLLLAGCGGGRLRQVGGQVPEPAEDANTWDDFEDGDGAFEMLEGQYAQQQEVVAVADPLEGVNRAIFNFNDALYFWVVKPVASVYADVLPEDARVGVSNFFDNVATPIRAGNCVLQGKFEGAWVEVQRFGINTTFGVLGLWDPALTDHGLEKRQEDFGQTLAVWGVGDGVYLVLPALGPSTLRDAGGKVPDVFLNPLYYLDSREWSIGASVTKYINIASLRLGEYESFKADAVDPYSAFKNVYLQYRAEKIRN